MEFAIFPDRSESRVLPVVIPVGQVRDRPATNVNDLAN